MSENIKIGRDTQPDLYYSTFWKIDFNRLSKRGIKYLIIDVDGTIALSRALQADPRAKDAPLQALKDGKIKNACLVSNTVYGKKREQRVAGMAKDLGIPYIAAVFFHQKPHRKPFQKALDLMGAKPEETAVIGDQIFTDIIGGNRLGLYTILIQPLGRPQLITIILLRRLRERRLLKKMGLKLDDPEEPRG